MMPNSSRDTNFEKGKYADTGVNALIELMEKKGSEKADIIVKLAGGASMFPDKNKNSPFKNIGLQNYEAVKEHIHKNNIPVVFEETGGTLGRSIIFDCSDGSIIVKSLNKI